MVVAEAVTSDMYRTVQHGLPLFLVQFSSDTRMGTCWRGLESGLEERPVAAGLGTNFTYLWVLLVPGRDVGQEFEMGEVDHNIEREVFFRLIVGTHES